MSRAAAMQLTRTAARVAEEADVSRPAPTLRRRPVGSSLSAGAAVALRAQGALHDELTDELCEMAEGLKRNAHAMGAGVRESLAVLSAVETSVERNVAAASRAAERATELHAVNRASCWQTAAVLAVVFVATAWMVFLIRLNRNRLTPLMRQHAA
jgi:hypothetical protein